MNNNHKEMYMQGYTKHEENPKYKFLKQYDKKSKIKNLFKRKNKSK